MAVPVKLGVNEPPKQIVVSGRLLIIKFVTVTINERLIVHAPVVPVSVYVVVVVGESAGLRIAGLLTPAVGVHEKLVALLAILGVNEAPLQIEVSARVVIVKLVTFTINERLMVQVPRVPVRV